MSDPSAPRGRGWSRSGEPVADDGWGPATAVYGSSAKRVGRAFSPADGARPADPEGWSPAGPLPQRDQRAARAADRRMERSIEALRPAKAHERGLPWWGALLVLIAIAGVGGFIDTLGTSQVKGGFNYGIVAASIVAILLVRRSHMFPIVIAPPIVYTGAALSQLYLRSSGLSNRRVVLDAAANYLVYGFPAIAAATAAVLIIAGIRLIARK